MRRLSKGIIMNKLALTVIPLALAFSYLLAPPVTARGWKEIGYIYCWGDERMANPEVDTVEQSDGTIVIAVKFHVFRITERRELRQNFVRINTPACSFGGNKIGQVQYPVWHHALKLHPGESIIFEKAEYEWSAKPIYGRLFPAQKFTADGAFPAKFVVDDKFLKSEGDYFAGWRCSLSSPFRALNRDYVSLNLVPLQYHPLEGRSSVLKRVTIHLRRIGGNRSNEQNSERVSKQRTGYLVITPERFLETLEPFLNFKRSLHPGLKVITTEEIGNTFAAIDSVVERETSRGTKFVLLVGHTTILPSAPYVSAYRKSGKPACFDGDFVYRCMGNETFPSVCVGRWPVTDDIELEHVIRRTLRRLKNPGLYQTKVIFAAHEERAPGKYQGCIRRIVDTIVPRSKLPLEPTLIFPAPPSRKGLGSRKADLIAALKRGASLFLYRGHGDTDEMATRLLGYFGGNQEDWYESQISIPTVFFSVACLNGQLTTAEGKEANGLCENLIVCPSPHHGVVACIGAIMPSPTVPNHLFAKRLVYHTYVEPKGSIAEVLNAAIFDTLLYGIEERDNSAQFRAIGDLYNIYGDPELPLTALPPIPANN